MTYIVSGGAIKSIHPQLVFKIQVARVLSNSGLSNASFACRIWYQKLARH